MFCHFENPMKHSQCHSEVMLLYPSSTGFTVFLPTHQNIRIAAMTPIRENPTTLTDTTVRMMLTYLELHTLGIKSLEWFGQVETVLLIVTFLLFNFIHLIVITAVFSLRFSWTN